MSLQQPRRISYTRRDLLSYHDDVTRYLVEFVDRITDASEMNTGRLYLTIHEALIDNANFALDNIHLESQIRNARQRKNILEEAYALGYQPSPVSAASVDVEIFMLSGVAPSGGKTIPIYTRLSTTVSPVIEFLTSEQVVIAEGEPSAQVSAIQGYLVSSESLSASSNGEPNQRYELTNANTPHIYIEVRVDGVLWTEVDDWADSDEESQHYRLEFDEDDITTIIFGDDEFGKAPNTGSAITASYIVTDAEDGNVSPESISRLIGTLASDVGVINDESASGGAVSETNDSIRRNAPATRRAFQRAVTKDDYVAEAISQSGVYNAFAQHQEGTRTDVYIMPEGGGTASSLLIQQIQDHLDDVKVEGAVPVVHALEQASIKISVNAVLSNRNIQKSTAKQKIRQATLEALDFRELTRGRGFTISDLAGIYENIDDLIDLVDFTVLTRVPRVEQSNSSAPEMKGRVTVGTTSSYDTWLVTAISATQFIVTKNGTPQSAQGTVATAYTSDNSEVSFTLGVSGDTLTIGDTWTWTTSEYVDNIVIDDNETMQLELDSDLVISVYYPREYDVATKSAAT